MKFGIARLANVIFHHSVILNTLFWTPLTFSLHAAELPDDFPPVEIKCNSTASAAGSLTSDPTLDGGWYRPRRDKGLTGQSPLIGGIDCPEVLWALDISDHGMWLELKPGDGLER